MTKQLAKSINRLWRCRKCR